ncbi:MAG: F0F1 ATP synthase subunit delta, partial [Proteobacteria bacterium]
MTAGLRGASAESLAQLRQRLAGATDAARVGDDLFGVAALLRAEPSLRRIATDAATDAAAKSGLVRSVLEGKVAAESLDLAGAAAGLRWTASRDLADALEHLGVEAIVSSAGDAGRLEDELFSVGQLVNDNHELRNALSDPARSASDKAALLTALLDGKALPAT